MYINAQTAFAKCSLALSLELCFLWVPVFLHLGWHAFCMEIDEDSEEVSV